ncbi:MAG: sterol desaturase family protein [Hyphomonas sp.]
MLDLVQDLIPAVAGKAQFILTMFAAVTVLAWLKAGREAFQWTGPMRRSGAVNLGIVAFNIVTFAIPVVATGMLLHLMRDVPRIPAQAWQDAPWLVRAFMALLIFDLANYAMHRFSHANRWVWPLHAVHHSDTQMHFLSANRAHILEWLFLIPVGTAVAFICGLSVSDVAFLALAREAHQYYVHSNLDWSHGPLRHVIAGPRFHRWHHIDRIDAHNRNFSLFFPFIDLAFGTYYMPGPARALPTGFSGNPGENLTRLLLFPFLEWARLIRGGSAPAERARRS